jgi:rod shape-determining protein MreD
VIDRTPGIRPRPTLWRRLDATARASFPAVTAALLLLLISAPLELPGQAQLQPAIGLACVFFWSLFRPAAMSPPVVFALGLLLDLLGMEPVGVSVLTLLIAHGLAVSWRRSLVKQGFLLVWLSFVVAAAVVALLQWALISLLTFRLLPAGPGLFQFAVTAGLYPALATLLTRAHRSVAAPERA